MLDRPSFVLRVCAPVVAPIAARPGQLVVVHPGHPTHTLATVTPDGQRVVRHGYVPDGALYGPLLILIADGVLVPLDPRLPQSLRRALAS